MPYHVELRRSHQRAWLFNLEADALRARVLAPWSHGAGVVADDRRWEPRETAIRILEGLRLDPADLAHGQGWNNAERSGRDVTEEMLARPVTATVVSPTREGHDLGVGLLEQLGVAAVDWGEVRAGLLAPERRRGAHAALVMIAAAPGPWLFDAGLAIGAFGDRAIVVAAEPGAPLHLGGVAVIPADAASVGGRLGSV